MRARSCVPKARTNTHGTTPGRSVRQVAPAYWTWVSRGTDSRPAGSWSRIARLPPVKFGPTKMKGNALDFSCSGLKTAVLYHVREHPEILQKRFARGRSNAARERKFEQLLAAVLRQNAGRWYTSYSECGGARFGRAHHARGGRAGSGKRARFRWGGGEQPAARDRLKSAGNPWASKCFSRAGRFPPPITQR